MRRLIIVLLGAAFVATMLLPAVAQQRGGGARGGGAPTTSGSGQREPEAHPPQHPQVRAGVETAGRVQQRARDLEKHAAGGGSLKTLMRDRDRIREQIHDLEQAHDRWKSGLGEQDRLRLQDPLKEMDQQRDRLRIHLRDLNTALAAPTPDRSRIQELARQIVRETDNWRTAWRMAAQ